MKSIRTIMNTSFYLFMCATLILGCKENSTSGKTNQLDPDEILSSIADRLYGAVQSASSPRLPRSVEDGKVRYTSSEGWTSGFLPGMLWMIADYDNSRDWTQYAELYTKQLEEVQYLTSHHDLGFMLYNSYGRGYTASNSDIYKQVLVNGAKSLASRYDSLVGMVKSWDRPGKWQYPVIIDNMMNLEYLFWATRATGDSSYYAMALSHATSTLRDHYRADVSCYHVVDYDTLTGEPIWKGTHQGLADESIWARGQAWGLYGFAMAYRETEDVMFLEHARRIATFLMNHGQMPLDKVPYWDLEDPDIPNAPRDVSAAAIMASGLIELSTYVPEEREAYIDYAMEMLVSLSENYRYESASESFFFLDQSVGNKPKNKEVSIPIIYADYYFIEALLRLKQSQI